MRNKQKMLEGAAILVFALSVVPVLIFGYFQWQKIIANPGKSGVIGWNGCAWFFIIISLKLAISDYKETKEKGQRTLTPLLTCLSYGWWLFWVTLNLSTTFILRGLKWHTVWVDWQDMVMIIASAVCYGLVVLVAKRLGLTLKDPRVRGFTATAWKTVSQTALGALFLLYPHLTLLWVLATMSMGIVTIFLRLLQILFSVFVDGWSTQRKAMLWTEVFNMLSWLFAIWAWWRVS